MRRYPEMLRGCPVIDRRGVPLVDFLSRSKTEPLTGSETFFEKTMANIREAIDNPPMFIPWGGAGSAVNIARTVGSRLSMPTLQGLANWARSNAAREATMNAIKQTPRLVAEDIVIDGIGNATTPITERYGDSVGFLKTAAKGRPLATIIDGGLTLVDIPWQDRFNNAKSFGVTAAEAASYNPELIDLSVQNIPSPKRTDIRLNEPLLANPKGLANYQLIKGN